MSKENPFLFLQTARGDVFIELTIEFQELADHPYPAGMDVVDARKIVIE